MAYTIQRPAFTWWPYRTLALLVPALAATASYFALEMAQGSTRDEQMLSVYTVFLAVLGAGNAYLFAIAIGDFGKSVLAVPIGALAGFLAARIFSYPPANGLYLLVMLVLVIYALASQAYSTPMGCASIFVLGIMSLIMLFGGGPRFEPSLSQICGYPFVCGVVAGAMPYERNLRGMYLAWVTGTLNACYGMMWAVLWYLAAFVAFALIISWLNPLGKMDGEILETILRGAWFGVANFYCVRSLFYSVYRVSESAGVVEIEGTEDVALETEKDAAPKGETL